MTDILRILAGPVVWLAAFSAVYGLHGLVCGHGITGTLPGGIALPRALLVSAYVLAVLPQAVVLTVLHSARFGASSPFVRFVSLASGWVGLVAAAWTLLPAATTTYCV